MKHRDGSFSEDRMVTLRPIDPVAIEKQLESPHAPVISVSVSTIDAADVDGFPPRERLQEEEAPARSDCQQRPADVPLDAPSIQWDVRVRSSFALAFVGLLCAMVVEFVSEIPPLRPDSPDYGYDEALGTETSFLSSANLLSNCSDDGLVTAAGSKDGLDRLGVSAIAAHAAASLTASFTSKE
jgi:hypothetical protein